jgi:hypothetical protein
MKKIIQKSIFLLFPVCFLFLVSCEPSDTASFREGIQDDVAANNVGDDTLPTTGQATFWTDSSLNSASITVVCGNNTQMITNSSSSTPSCGASGTATFTLPAGTYNYSAWMGAKTWSGVITVTVGGCAKQKLVNTVAATGEATFWTDSSLSNGSMIVTCNGTSKTINSSFLNTPLCGATGAATFTLNPGTYDYSVWTGTKTLSGVITVTSGGCAKQKIVDDNVPVTGQATFWTDSSLSNGSMIVSCNGTSKTINSSLLSAPSCGATGAATFTLNPGTYDYSVWTGTKTLSGVITVTSGGCAKQKIVDTVINLSLDGKWKDPSDGLTVTVSGSSGTFFALGTSHWKTAGDRGYVSVGGAKWRSIASVNSTTWNYQDLWLKTTNGNIDGYAWSATGTITMSADGQTITTTSKGPISGTTVSVTFNRVN